MISRRAVNLALAALLAAVWAIIALGRRDAGLRNFRWIPQMEDSLALEAQRAMPPSSAGPARSLAVPGAIARGFAPLDSAAAPADPVARLDRSGTAGREPANPFGSNTDLERGKAVFLNHCAVCHGQKGLGDGPVTRRGVPPPPSLGREASRALSDARVFDIITRGAGNMPGYSGQVGREDRWKAVLFLRRLQAAEAAP